MAHRAATDEICVAGGMGNAPIKQKAGTRQSLRLLSFGSKMILACPRLSGTSHYSGRALIPVYIRKPKQARETNCYKGSFTKPVQNSTTVSSLFLRSIHKIPLQKKSHGRLTAGLRASLALISAFGAVDDFRSEELRLKIYPQSGANGDIIVVDTAGMLTIIVPEAAVVDISSVT